MWRKSYAAFLRPSCCSQQSGLTFRPVVSGNSGQFRWDGALPSSLFYTSGDWPAGRRSDRAVSGPERAGSGDTDWPARRWGGMAAGCVSACCETGRRTCKRAPKAAGLQYLRRRVSLRRAGLRGGGACGGVGLSGLAAVRGLSVRRAHTRCRCSRGGRICLCWFALPAERGASASTAGPPAPVSSTGWAAGSSKGSVYRLTAGCGGRGVAALLHDARHSIGSAGTRVTCFSPLPVSSIMLPDLAASP